MQTRNEYSQQRILLEISTLGAQNALRSLSILINKEIRVSDATINSIHCSDLINVFGGERAHFISILLSTVGESINGAFLFLLSKDDAKLLVQDMFSHTEDSVEFDEIGQSFLCELGNIIGNSYINLIADKFDSSMETKTPEICFDTLGSILSNISLEYMDANENILIMENKFICEQLNFTLHALFFPNNG